MRIAFKVRCSWAFVRCSLRQVGSRGSDHERLPHPVTRSAGSRRTPGSTAQLRAPRRGRQESPPARPTARGPRALSPVGAAAASRALSSSSTHSPRRPAILPPSAPAVATVLSRTPDQFRLIPERGGVEGAEGAACSAAGGRAGPRLQG